MEPIKIRILGGGFGGLYTALYLSHRREVKAGEWRITLVEPKDHFIFTPLLYELLTGELQRWQIAPSYRQLLAGTGIEQEVERAIDVDFHSRKVILAGGGVLDYDYLVLAVGREQFWPEIGGLRERALTFRGVADAEKLQIALHELENSRLDTFNIAVIGGGPNGVELACKLADRVGVRGKVHLIERNGDILNNLPKSIRVASYKSLSARNISVYLNTALKKVSENSLTLKTDDRSWELGIDLIIQTAGTRLPDWIAALDCRKDTGGNILTRPTLQLTDYPEVLAAGDLATIEGGKQRVPTTAQAAYQGAARVAKNLVALLENRPLKAYYYLHLGDMLTLGKRRAIVSSFGINIVGRLGDIIRRFVYVFRLPGQRHRMRVLKHELRNLFLSLRPKIKLSSKVTRSGVDR